MKKKYSPPTITPLADEAEANRFLAEQDAPPPFDITGTKRYPRGIWRLPLVNREGRVPLVAIDSNGFTVGWGGFTNVMDLHEATARLWAVLDEADPVVLDAAI